MSVKKSNKQLYRVIQIMTLTGTLVVANVLFTMVTHRHIWSGQDVLDTQIASSIVNTSVEAKRGTIYDRNHNVIAQEVTAYTVVAYLDDSLEDEDGNPDYVKDADYTAKQLGTVLDNINEEKVAKIIEDAIDDKRSQTELGTGTKRLDKDTMEKIKDLNLPGIDFIETTNRNYPTTPFSSNLIGFAAYDEEKEKISGVMGLEQTLDEYLSGKDGQVQYQQTVDGSILPGTTQVFEEAEDGKDVVLTLDASLQRTVEEQMQITMEQNNAEAAWCAVMEVETGKILAWASYPTFDQNKHLEIPSYQDRISQAVYEPGSVMKPFTYAIALDTGVFPRNTTFRAGTFTYTFDPNTNKITRVANGTETAYPPISDALEEDFGVITFEQGLAFSSNVGICELLSNYVNYNQYVDYMDKFGFFKYVDSPYVSESLGVNNIANLPQDYLSSGFGQSSSITILQLLQAYTAIFNGGTMVKPYVVDSIVDSTTGEVVEEYDTEVVGTPISEDTANQVVDLMEGVLQDGASGARFRIDGVDMAAKTGTGEIYNEETGVYDKYKYTSSIMAAAPSSDAKIMVYYGMVSTNYVNYSAEPFKQIMQAALIANGISGSESDTSSEEETYEKWETYTMPGLTNHSLTYANNKLADKKVHVTVIGDGQNVVDQYPAKDSTINSNDRVFILTDGQTITMPDMTGWTRKDLTAFWQLTGISIETTGYGKVKSQNIETGQTISTDTEIQVELE